MLYGIIKNGQLIIHKTPRSGDKPIINQEPPTVADDQLLYVYYEDTGIQILEKWGIRHNDYEPGYPTDAATEEDYIQVLDDLGVRLS